MTERGDTTSAVRPPEALIAVRGVCKGYRNGGAIVRVLEGLDFDLEAGETIAIIGASGIGKSTLLHILGTLDRPDSGRMYFRGESIFDYPDARLAKFRNECIGFVFQFHHLLPEFSALENTMMPALIQGWRREPASQAAREILVRVGLQDRLDYRVGKLSGGSSSVWPWPGRSCCGRRFCWPTSPPETWIGPTANRFTGFCSS